MKKRIGILLVSIVLILAVGFVFLYRNGLSLVGCTSEPEDGAIRVACVGDSITYGYGISGWPDNSYPARLQELLGDSCHVNNYGANGFAVQEDADLSYRALPCYRESMEFDPDILVFMMGSNDSKPRNWVDGETFRRELLEMLDSYGKARIILCTPAAAFFPEGQSEGPIAHSIQPLTVEQIAGIIREVAAERGCPLVDIHALTQGKPEWFLSDGVHPNNQGAAAIAEAVYGEIAKEDG